MSTKVNPPPQVRIPDKFFNDPDTRSFFERQQLIIFQLWQRTGGSNDSVAGQKIITVINNDIILDTFGGLIVVDAESNKVKVTLPVITTNFIGESVTVEIINSAFDTNVFAANGQTVVGDTNVLMDQQFMSITFTSITIDQWVIT